MVEPRFEPGTSGLQSLPPSLSPTMQKSCTPDGLASLLDTCSHAGSKLTRGTDSALFPVPRPLTPSLAHASFLGSSLGERERHPPRKPLRASLQPQMIVMPQPQMS